MPTGEANTMLAELVDCPSIESYAITAFLSDLSRQEPTSVVRLLNARIERWEKADEGDEYQAVPFHWDQPLQARERPEYPALLRELRDWLANEPSSWKRYHAGGDLFAAVAGTFDDTVLEVLDEAANSNDSDQITAVAAMLRNAPRALVFEDVEFVRRILAAAEALGEECIQQVGGALSAAVVSGARMGTPGKPFKEDLEQRDRAREIADGLPSGSTVERFYRSLQESAEHSIKWSADRDERLGDHRDW